LWTGETTSGTKIGSVGVVIHNGIIARAGSWSGLGSGRVRGWLPPGGDWRGKSLPGESTGIAEPRALGDGVLQIFREAGRGPLAHQESSGAS
jgi:hypothetical protein